MKETYSIYEAKAKLSEIIRRVKNRRTVTITDRGVPVARVVPVVPESERTFEGRLKELTVRGALKSAIRDPSVIVFQQHVPGSIKRFLTKDRD